MHCPKSSINCDGFTLIELLIVVVILSSLAAVVVPRFAAVGDSAKSGSVEYSTKLVQGAIDRYHADNGYYPSKDLWGQVCSGVDYSAVSLSKPYSFLLNRLRLFSNGKGGVCDGKRDGYIWGPYIIKSVPANPRNGHEAIKIIPSVSGQDDTSTAFGWTYHQVSGEFLPFDS